MRQAALRTDVLCPFSLTVDRVPRFLNAEFADHPIYDGFELQWFDDTVHGTGLLAFLSRRQDRRVDYYLAPGLRLDRSGYAIGGGIGEWVEADFDVARLEVDDGGVFVDVSFTDVDGRRIEVAIDDRGAGRRQASQLLAPVGSGIERPISLMLVYLHGFDLLRRTDSAPRILIEGEPVSTGRLPGAFFHRRHLIKAAAPLTVATVCRERSGPVDLVDRHDPGDVSLDGSGEGIAGLNAGGADASAAMSFDPPVPSLASLPEGQPVGGDWRVALDGAPITGGVWHAVRQGNEVRVGLDVTQEWRPPTGMSGLMRLVTRLVPVFRRWPTTYRWSAEVDLDSATIRSRWERTETGESDTYRRATGSASRRPRS